MSLEQQQRRYLDRQASLVFDQCFNPWKFYPVSENIFSSLTLYGHIKTAEQRTIIQQYGDWYTSRWWVGCYIWYSKEGPGRAAALPSPLLAVPNVTAHQTTHQRQVY